MTEILAVFLSPAAWLALLTLVLLETVLGIDNIVFLSIMTSRLPAKDQPRARTIGLILAMLARIALLFSITLLMRLTEPLFHVETESLSMAVSGQSLIILCGGIFLLYKSVTEIHHKIESENPTEEQQAESGNSFASVIIQIVLLDIVFSLDSVLTAVGMVSFADFGRAGALSIMVAAVVIAVGIMLIFSGPISRFVNAHPSVQMLALSFLILISVTLLMEAGHLAHLVIMDTVITELPKGYIYFAISFSLLVEMLNMRVSRRKAD